MRKKIILLFFVLALFSASMVFGQAQGVTVDLNQMGVTFDQSTGLPYIDGTGRVMTPLRAVLEKAGAQVGYDTESRMAIISYKSTNVVVPVDRKVILVNGVTKENDAAATIRDGRIYLPIRIVMESLGYRVQWDGQQQKVLIDMAGGGSSSTDNSPVQTTASQQTVVEPSVPNKVGNVGMNLYNGGFMARENNILVYVNFSDGEKLYRVDVKTGKGSALSDRKARSANIVNGYVYYRQENIMGGWEVVRSKLDGTDSKVIVQENASDLWVTEDTLYYYSPQTKSLMKKSLDGNSTSTVYEWNMRGISMFGDSFVYEDASDTAAIKPGKIYKLNAKNIQRTEIDIERPGETVATVAVSNERIVFTNYMDSLRLWSFDLATSKKSQVSSRSAYNMNCDSQYVYTLYPYNGTGLYKIPFDGGEPVKLKDGWVTYDPYNPYIMVLGDYVFYADKLSSNTYQWVRVKKDGSEVKRISTMADFME